MKSSEIGRVQHDAGKQAVKSSGSEATAAANIANGPVVAVGLSGYRLGHVMRTSRIIDELVSLGCRLIVYTGGRPAAYLRQTRPALDVRDITFLRYEQHARGIAYTRTALTNIVPLLSTPRTVARIRDELRRDNVSLALVDFEPLLPRAARSLGIPVVSLNHQNILHGVRRPDRWTQAVSFAIVKTVIFAMQTAAELAIVSSFFRRPLDEKFRLIGPIYRQAILDVRGKEIDEGFVLVYSAPFVDRLILSGACGRDTRFVLFTECHYANLPPNVQCFTIGPGFVDYLRRCRAVITNGGHQTMSEALLLGKPVLAVPQAGQYEERFNCQYLETSGCGAIGRRRTLATDVAQFLANLAKYHDAFATLDADTRFCVRDGAAEAVGFIKPWLKLDTDDAGARVGRD